MNEPCYRRPGTLVHACVLLVVCVTAAVWFFTMTGDHVWAWLGVNGFGLTAADQLGTVRDELDRPRRPRDLPLPDPTREDTP